MRNGIRIGDLRDMTFFETRLRGLVKQLEGELRIMITCKKRGNDRRDVDKTEEYKRKREGLHGLERSNMG